MPGLVTFDLTELQNQVALATQADNLADKVTTWANRTLMDIASRAFFTNQLRTANVQIPAATTTIATTENVIDKRWLDVLTTGDVVNFHQIQMVKLAGTAITNTISTYYWPLIRHSPQDLYGQMHGGSGHIATDAPKGYAPLFYTITASGVQTSTYWAYPKVAIYPYLASTATDAHVTSTGCLNVIYLQAPSKLSESNKEHWIVEKYFHVVLAGVLRYARLFLGDAQGALMEIRDYENGIRDIIRAEETLYDNTPVLRGATPEDIVNMG